MKSAITEIYKGNLIPCEKFTYTSEYIRLEENISAEMEFWEKNLSFDNFKKLEDLQGILCQSNSIENEQHFAFGFKLAMRIVLETFSEKEMLL